MNYYNVAIQEFYIKRYIFSTLTLCCSAAAVAGMRVIRCSTAEKINGGWLVELTKVCEDFTITEKAPTMAFSWLKAPTRHFQK